MADSLQQISLLFDSTFQKFNTKDYNLQKQLLVEISQQRNLLDTFSLFDVLAQNYNPKQLPVKINNWLLLRAKKYYQCNNCGSQVYLYHQKDNMASNACLSCLIQFHSLRQKGWIQFQKTIHYYGGSKDCVICQEQIMFPIVTPCGHEWCINCQLKRENLECYICRRRALIMAY